MPAQSLPAVTSALSLGATSRSARRALSIAALAASFSRLRLGLSDLISLALLAAVGTWPLAARASGSVDSLSYAIGGGIAGLLVALAVLVLGLRRFSWAKLAVVIPISLLCLLVGPGIGSIMYEAGVQSRFRAHQVDELKYSQSALRAAACEGSDATGIAKAARGADPDLLSRVVLDCSVYRRGPQRMVAFTTLMPQLAGPTAGTSTPALAQGYCTVLLYVHEDHRLEHLRALRQLKLPILCPGDRQPTWWRGLHGENGRRSAEVAQSRWTWLLYLRDEGVNLVQASPAGGRNLLHMMVGCEEPRVIRLALELGADPGAADPQRNWSSRVRWMIRRHRPEAENCALAEQAGATDLRDIAFIDARMGTPSQAEVNAPYEGNNQTPLWGTLDGTRAVRSVHAGLLARLIELDADIDARDFSGRTFLHTAAVLSPQALAVLARQPAAKLAAIGKVPDKSLHARDPEPLVYAARRRQDHALIALVCAHGAVGCS